MDFETEHVNELYITHKTVKRVSTSDPLWRKCTAELMKWCVSTLDIHSVTERIGWCDKLIAVKPSYSTTLIGYMRIYLVSNRSAIGCASALTGLAPVSSSPEARRLVARLAESYV